MSPHEVRTAGACRRRSGCKRGTSAGVQHPAREGDGVPGGGRGVKNDPRGNLERTMPPIFRACGHNGLIPSAEVGIGYNSGNGSRRKA